MSKARIIQENGSFRLIECAGRFAVIEARAGAVYGLEGEGGSRPEAPDRSATMADAVPPADWTDEAAARARFDELVARGDGLARCMW